MKLKAKKSSFSALVLAAQKLATAQKPEQSYQKWQEALALADTDFKRAYVLGEAAAQSAVLGQWEAAIRALQEALVLSKALAWSDFLEIYSLDLSNLFCHLARFQEAELPLQQGLEILRAKQDLSNYLTQLQNYAKVLLEQAKYAAALPVLEEALALAKQFKDPFAVASLFLHLSQVQLGLGNFPVAASILAEARDLILQYQIRPLLPYLEFFTGRLLLAQGTLGAALEKFELAQAELGNAQDLPGKVEVFLNLTASLLEYGLIKQAENWIGQMTQWEDLAKFPALSHSVHLRRLALAVFSGHLNQADMQLLSSEGQELGRLEDWLQFWFHLALAAKRLQDTRLLQYYLHRAKSLIQKMSEGLDVEQQKVFLQRPDILRLSRLMDQTIAPALVQARRDFTLNESAESASFAPPEQQKS